MNGTLMASTIALAFSFGAPAFAQDATPSDDTGRISVTANELSAAAARDSATATALTNAFNTSTATATTALTATVTGNALGTIGNIAANSGNADGAIGGAGGASGTVAGDTSGTAQGGPGGNGGNGGSLHADAGKLNMSNTMSSVGQSAAGVMSIAQISGPSSLVQQSNNIQANLNVGK
ncbi:MAG: hypothetical protein V7642_5251 [Burkholderiales bacterium]